MVESSNLAPFLSEAVEASELTEANEAGEVPKVWKITTEDFRVVFVFEFNNLRTNITLF